MVYEDAGYRKYAIGIPTNEEKKELIANGYWLWSIHETTCEPHTKFEIWITDRR